MSMRQEDFYTGEPVITGSPPSFTQANVIGTNVSQDEVEAANMAAFGKYDYDPSTRRGAVQFGQPQMMMPGQFPMNPPVGIGANPYQYSQYGNLQPTYQQYMQPQPQPQQQVPSKMLIPGVNPSGEYLPMPDYEEKIEELKTKYWKDIQESEAKQAVDRMNSPYYGGGYGYNYYGVPYFTTNQYQVNSELNQAVNEMVEQAKENRIQLNLRLAQLAHNFTNDNISQEALEQRYRGKVVDIPSALVMTPQEYYDYNKYNNMVPFDNSQVYRDFHAKVSREFNEIIPADSDLNDTFKNMGIIDSQWELEEEQHRRRDFSGLYDSGDSYKYFVRRKAKERYAEQKGLTTTIAPQINPALAAQQVRQDFVNSTQALSKSATIGPDGTLNITCNIGSHMGQTYSVNNANEAEYAEKRERFGRFIDSIPGSIYLDQVKEQKKAAYNGH